MLALLFGRSADEIRADRRDPVVGTLIAEEAGCQAGSPPFAVAT
jgi:hypothetical protein